LEIDHIIFVMNRDYLSTLPDELVLHIMYFMDPVSVAQCRRVNKRLSRLSYDKILLRKFPHYVLNREVYFKEEAYHSEELFLELMKRDTNDLVWLVPRTTSIIKECQMDSMSWALLTCAAWDATWDAARYAAWDDARYAAWDAAWDAATDARNAAWYAAWDATWDATWYAATDAARDAGNAAWIAAKNATKDAFVVTGHDIIKLVKSLGITDTKGIGEKCYQIAECKVLLSINKELCLKIMAIIKEYELPKSIQIPREKLAILQSNPWIQQYVELYGS
jgi:hypothetical protein